MTILEELSIAIESIIANEAYTNIKKITKIKAFGNDWNVRVYADDNWKGRSPEFNKFTESKLNEFIRKIGSLSVKASSDLLDYANSCNEMIGELSYSDIDNIEDFKVTDILFDYHGTDFHKNYVLVIAGEFGPDPEHGWSITFSPDFKTWRVGAFMDYQLVKF